KGEPQYDDLENRLFQRPVIAVPTITIASDFDGAAADGSSYRSKFSGSYSHRVLEGIGHNVPQEAPRAFADADIEVTISRAAKRAGDGGAHLVSKTGRVPKVFSLRALGVFEDASASIH